MKSAPSNYVRIYTQRRLINTLLPLSLLCILSLLVALLAPADRGSAPPKPDTQANSSAPLTPTASASTGSTARDTERAREAYGRMELSFEANRGQTDASVNFLARGAGYTLFLRPVEAVFVMSRRGAGEGQEQVEGGKALSTDRAAQSGRGDVLHARGRKASESEPAPKSSVLRMKLSGADAGALTEGAGELAGKVNYFIGNDPAKWRAGVPTYGRVRFTDVYPGIDVVYYGNQRQLEYDFVVAPGRDARAVRLEFEGADKVEVDAGGDLLLTVDGEVMRQLKPVLYQEAAGGGRSAVEGGYALQPDGRVGFRVGEYDASRALVIDPVLVYSTYLGGSDFEDGSDIKVDSAGNAYICGITNSTNFPVANAIQGSFGGRIDDLVARDAFVTKLNSAGTSLVYSTYLGGNKDDRCNKIAVDDLGGNVYLAGETTSHNFPTANAFQSTFGGGLSDVFVTKLGPGGSAIVFSTYIGGSIFDAGQGIALDSSRNVYITGRTTSDNYPTVNPIQAAYSGGPGADVIISKLNAAGNALVYSTYLGGNAGTEGGFEAGFSIAVDSAGNAYVAGQTRSTNFPTANAIQATFGGGFPDGDAFVTKVNAKGDALVYSTYLGGSENDIGFEIALDSSNSAYVAGVARSDNFPRANAFQSALKGTSDAFLTKINPQGDALVYSTYFGGSGDDSANGIAVNASNEPYLAIGTSSTDLPTANPTQAASGGGIDAAVTRFNAAGNALIYSTYLGGSGLDAGLSIALDSALSMYIVGRTASTNFPTLNPVQSAYGGAQDAFVTKISLDPPPPTPTPTPTCPPTINFTVGNTSVVLGTDSFEIQGGSRSISLTPGTPSIGAFGGSITIFADAPTPIGEYTATITQTITFEGGQSATLSRRLIYTVTASERRLAADSGEAKTFDLGTRGKIDVTLNSYPSTFVFFNNDFGAITVPARNDEATYLLHDIPVGSPCATPTPTPTPTATPTPATPLVQFSAATYDVNEGAGSVTITVARAGDTSAAATVDYATAPDAATLGCDVVNGSASERCDYTTTLGTLRFAANEATKTFRVFITDDVYLDGAETYTLSLSNPTGGSGLALGAPTSAVVTITDNDTNANAANPVDNAQFFVSMHYVDFLNRQGEAAGVAAWTNALNNCPSGNQSCDRVGVSSAFFRTDEFMLKGFFVIRFYKVSLGPPPNYRDFTRDSQRVTADTAAEVVAAREAFTNEWVQRADFKAIYDGLSNQAYVDKLEQTAGVTLQNKAAQVAALNGNTKTRAQVLREIVESQEVRQRMYHDAFVLMEYYGYLRRDPEAAGFNAWLNYLNAHPGDWRTMVRGFVNSVEYRKRFGNPGAPQPG